MADFFKVGDKVRRIGRHNGDNGACVGTIATVTKVYEDGFINVYYPGCYDDEDGSEIWDTRFTELFQESRHENGKDEEEGPKMTTNLSEAYLAMQEASGIKVGDTVRVLRKAVDGEMGWGAVWGSDMDKYVGETGVVRECVGIYGLRVSFSGSSLWRSFPFFVLEKTKDAPRFIEINGFEVPEPEREPLEKGERYWAVMTDFSYLWLDYTWQGDEFDRCFLRRGIIHKTEEAAKIHAKALLSFTENKGEEARNVR